MAFTHSKDGRVLINERHASGHVSGFTASHRLNLSEVPALGDGGMKFIAGLLDGAFSVDGYFDPDSDSLWSELKASRGTTEGLLATVLPDGFTIGSPAFVTIGNISSFTTDSAVTDAVSLAMESQPNGGVDWGVSLHPHTAETATGNAASVDNTASSSNGGVATLHVTAASGTSPTLDAAVQHSVDDSVWVDLIEFTQATAETSERKTVTGTVNRYLRGEWEIGGTSPSFTFVIAFARR